MTPNQVTTIRIFLLPLIVFFYLADFIPWGKFIAVCLFALAALTDFIDGKMARARNQVTDLGKFLDTIADKLLITVALILVVADGTILAPLGAVFAIIILCREFLVTFLRQVAVNKGKVLAADKLGKYKALFQDLALPAFMLLAFFFQYDFFAETTFLLVFVIVCYTLLGIAVAMTILSGLNYFIKNWKVFKDDSKEIVEEKQEGK
ncbi:MAG: CDP-diacylglycerol--glycerol-3-phosphate 3-phosphatidyltransferase [Clostridia bacterium]|nr:CDP-diacylglycerol--glycerol-3-phosphate 3-phosphatidyltransferase [Clostridia bacterium]